MSTAKERHYQQLASKLSSLSRELEETQFQSATLAKQLQSMNNLGAMQAAQFMAVARVLDAELAGSETEKEGAGQLENR